MSAHLAERASRTAHMATVWSPPPGLYGSLAAVNHRTIGRRYIVTGLVFFALAGIIALIMRIQLAWSDQVLISPELYNQLFTMHGTTMMFLFAVPILEGAGMYLVPLMIGARDMAFPRLNAFGYWVYLIAGITLYGSLLFGSAPDGGWFSYPPLTGPGYSLGAGLDVWVTAITFLEVAALVAAIELIVTILKQRAPGMTMRRVPLFIWAQLVMSVMILFAMPPLIAGSVMLALDRLVGTHFFSPGGGGDPVLWQHLFWIFGHPEVYIILMPALGIVSMVLPVFARRRIIGYTLLVASLIAIGFLSFGLWVHHMFTTGLPFLGLSFFAAASMMIAVPSGVQVFALIATLWQGRLRNSTAFLFVAGFLIIFVIGGMTGVMVAAVPFDLQVHDSYFVVAHFHYVLIGGAVFPLFAGIYYWFPKVTGRLLSETLGRWNFWLMFIGMHVAFFPMHELGLDGMPRRVYTFAAEAGWDGLNLIATVGAFLIAAGVLAFVVNAVASFLFGSRAGRDPWHADTLEWATDSPPAPYNFEVIPTVASRHPLWDGPVADPDAPADLTLFDPEQPRRETLATTILDARPDFRRILPGPSVWPLGLAIAVAIVFIGSMVDLVLVPIGAALSFIAMVGWLWPDRGAWLAKRELPDHHGLPSVVNGVRSTEWWGVLGLVLIEGVVFLTLIVSYFYLKFHSGEWPQGGIAEPELLLPTVGTVILVASAGGMAWAARAIRSGHERRLRTVMFASMALLVLFLALKYVEYSDYDYNWSTNAYGSIVFTIVILHVTHVIAVLLKSSVISLMAWRGYFDAKQHAPVDANALYWYFVAAVWLPLYATLYLSHRW